MKNSSQPAIAKIYLEKRGGKSVTIISGLHTYGSARLELIAKDLKKSFGTGGTVKNGIIEIQGDNIIAIKEYFAIQKAAKKEGSK